jgi:hypothetical protein
MRVARIESSHLDLATRICASVTSDLCRSMLKPRLEMAVAAVDTLARLG